MEGKPGIPQDNTTPDSPAQLPNSLRWLDECLKDTSLGLWHSLPDPERFIADSDPADVFGLPDDLNTFTREQLRDRIHPDDRYNTTEKTNAFFAGETASLALEFRILTITGVFRWIEVRGRIVSRDSDGHLALGAGVFRDITNSLNTESELEKYRSSLEELVHNKTLQLRETNRLLRSEVEARRATESELAESERRWRTMFDSVPVPCVLADEELTIELVNNAFCTSTAFDRSAIAGKSCYDLISLSNIPEHDSLREGIAHNTEATVQTATGEPMPVTMSIRMLEIGAAGLRVLMSFHDVSHLKRIERELSESKEYLEVAVEGANIGLWHHVVATGIVERSDGWARLLGFEPSEVDRTIEFWEKRIHPKDREHALSELNIASVSNRDSFSSEYRFRTGGGEWHWVLDKGRVVQRDENGRPKKSAGIIADIHQSKMAQQSLQQSERFNRTLIMTSPYGIAVRDRAGNLIDCNRAWNRLLGLPPELVNASIEAQAARLMYGDGSEYVRKWVPKIKRVYRDGGNLYIPEVRLKADEEGRPRWLSQRFYALEDESGHSDYVVVMNEDITERKESEEVLSIASHIIRDSGAAALVWANDKEWTIQHADGNTDEVFDLSADDLVSAEKPFLELVGSPKRDTLKDELSNTSLCAEPVVFPVATADDRWAEMRVTPLFSEDGSVSQYQAIIFDVTQQVKRERERRTLEERLRNAKRLESLAQLAGGIAHDFNNLLAVILGNAEMAEHRTQDAPKAKGNIDNIKEACESAARLCQKLLAASGKGQTTRDTLELASFLRTYRPQALKDLGESFSFELRIQAEPLHVHVDRGQLEDVISNLLVNSREAVSGPDGKVTITLDSRKFNETDIVSKKLSNDIEPGNYSQIEIADNGSGMSKNVLERIYDPFFSTKFTGRGLGMAAVLGVVQSHKGAIEIETARGKGTSIRIILPVSEINDNDSHLPTNQERDMRNTILLVDDEERVIEVASEMLEMCGFSVETATTGQKALEVFSKAPKKYSIVLLDFTMPGMNGREIFDRMREFDPDAEVIITSGYSDEDIKAHFDSCKPNGFLQKPYHFTQLRDLLKTD